MSHPSYRLRKSKRGISTVLGTLIFVGILITSVFPTYLYINEVNSYYNRVTTNLSRSDQDRGRENLEVYAYPVFFYNDTVYNGTTKLNIYVRNRSTSPINITRIWINNTIPSIGGILLSVAGTSDLTIEQINIPSDGYFDVWVITDKGNVFASATNTIQIENGSWSGGIPPYMVNIIINKHSGNRSYTINVTTDPPTLSYVHSTGEYILAQVSIGYKPGTFNVIVERNTTNGQLVLYNQSVVITPLNPWPWITVNDP